MTEHTFPETDPTTIVVDHFYPHEPEKVWRALTTPALMSQWLMEPIGFAPIKGNRFSFTVRPIEATKFSGDIACEILEIDEPRRLTISWNDANAAQPADWTVSWELSPEGHGTRVILTHSGFDPDDATQQHARKLMGGGWSTIARKLDTVLVSVD